MPTFATTGRIADVEAGRVFPGTVEVADGRIAAVREGGDGGGRVLVPGFVDAHVHVESSMMVPSEFARFAAPHGPGGPRRRFRPGTVRPARSG